MYLFLQQSTGSSLTSCSESPSMISEISCSLLAMVAERPAPLWPTLKRGENRRKKDKVEISSICRFCTPQQSPKFLIMLLAMSRISWDWSFFRRVSAQSLSCPAGFYSESKAQQKWHKKGVTTNSTAKCLR